SAANKTYGAVLHIVILLGENKEANVSEATTRSIAAPPIPPLTLPKQFAMEICDVDYLRTMPKTAQERGGNDSDIEKSRRGKQQKKKKKKDTPNVPNHLAHGNTKKTKGKQQD
ncbi:unnamed protein product, partial [Ectocarpus sp. 13 AM-2016]